MFSKDRTTERGYRAFSYPGFTDVRDAGGPFAHLAGHAVALAGVSEDNATRPATVDMVTTGFFKTLGVQPVYGRDFTMDEERPGTAARSVIISYKVWERSGLDRDILEQTVRINGQDFAIVGLSPQQFTGTTAILGAESHRATRAVVGTAGLERIVRPRRGRGCISEPGLRSRSPGDCADRAEAGWLRRSPRSRDASRPARETALDSRHSVSRGSIGPSLQRLFVRRRRTARGASAEARGSGSGR